MLTRDALLGSWTLVSAEAVSGASVIDAEPFGAGPYGIIHYLADGRMAVLIAHAQRAPIVGGRVHGSDADRLRAARTITAYAGTFDVESDRVIHHVEVNSFPNDVGVDYVRLAKLDGDTLLLATPPDLPADQRPMRLHWARYVARP